jgi:hypothetical protein
MSNSGKSITGGADLKDDIRILLLFVLLTVIVSHN